MTQGTDAEVTLFVEAAADFLFHFKEIPDWRQPGKVVYPLPEILLLVLLATLSGSEGFTDIALFGKERLALLQRFLPFANGTPSHDQLGAVFAGLDSDALQNRFVAWMASRARTPAQLVALDGKTARRSRSASKRALHVVSAFATQERLVLAQMTVDAKSNEIVAIPALLDLLSLEGAMVSIDAMGCEPCDRRKNSRERSKLHSCT